MSRTDPMDQMVDWRRIHEEFVEQFRVGWASPDPHAWDGFIGPGMEFVQPLLRHGSGSAHWWEETGRTLALLPDLRADVLSWAGDRETVFIAVRFNATLAGKPLTWDAVDVLRLTPEGKAVARHSFFDSAPVAREVLRRPRAWLRWWRSGVGPLLWRRRILRSVLARRLAAIPGRSHARSVGRP